MKSGLELIIEERIRQVEVEGFTSEHDDAHEYGFLHGRLYSPIRAAARCYLSNRADEMDVAPSLWPFDASWWKPSKDPVRNLVKAGALIAAEIDRLQREQNTTKKQEGEV